MKKLLLVVCLALSLPAAAQRWGVPGVRVTVAPPALRAEAVAVAPSARHVWIPGYWGWRNNAHVWMGGRWALPPHPGYVWEPGAWEQVGGAWTFYDGHWRTSEDAQPAVVYQPPAPPVEPVVVESAPPAPIVEVRPPIPFAAAAWVGGSWHWDGGRWSWIRGRWSAQPAGYTWEEHRWEKRADGRWERREGHWHPAGHHDHD